MGNPRKTEETEESITSLESLEQSLRTWTERKVMMKLQALETKALETTTGIKN